MANIYLYPQPFTSGQDTPFWQTLISSVQHGAEDTVFLTATRGMQSNLKSQMATWVSKEGLLPEVLTFDDLVFSSQDHFAALAFSHVYILESLLSDPKYSDLCADQTPAIAAQTLFETFTELQKHSITPAQLSQAFKSTSKKTGQAPSSLSSLFQDFLTKGKDWPFPSLYHAYENALTAQQKRASPHSKLTDWTGKNIFILGFWELPPYQRPLFTHMVKNAGMVAMQLHYSQLSPVYEAAQPLYMWLRSQFPELREIPFLGQVSRPKIAVLACENVIDEVQLALRMATASPNTGILIPESDPYHEQIRQYASGHSNWNTRDTAAVPAEMPLFSFLMALLDPELPSPAAMSRLLSHILVSEAIPDWHWPSVEARTLGKMPHWQWTEWERSVADHDSRITKLLALGAQIQKTKNLDMIFKDCCAATSLLGQPLPLWPATLITGLTQAISLTARIGGGSGRLRSVLKSLFSSPTGLPKDWPCYGKFESHMVRKDHWILLGSRDGVWPKVTRKAYALPTAVVRQLGLPTSLHYMQADAYFFHAVLHHATQTVTAIYPRVHDDVPQSVTMFLSGFEIRSASPHEEAEFSKDSRWSLSPALSVAEVSVEGRSLRPLEGLGPASVRDPRLDAEIDVSHLTLETFSPTRLERYQGCPYQYYLKHILNLAEDNDPMDVGPGMMGELIHDVFQSLTSTYRQEGRKDDTAQLQRAIDTAIAKQQHRHGPESMRSWIVAAKATVLLGNDHMPGIVPETLAAMDEASLPISAIAEEVSLGESPPMTFSVLETTFSLTGRIDAIYAIHDTDMLLIVDYKTGSKPYSKKDLDSYRNLQLPLYILMAQKQYPDKEVVGAAIIYARHREPGIDVMAITTEGKQALDLKRKRPKSIDAVYHHDTLFHTAHVIDSIREGKFGLSEVPIAEPFLSKRKDLCAHCRYKWACSFPERWDVSF